MAVLSEQERVTRAGLRVVFLVAVRVFIGVSFG
jgi:hypothetical protein